MPTAVLVVGGAGAGELRGVPAMVLADPGCAAVGVPAVELAMGDACRQPAQASEAPNGLSRASNAPDQLKAIVRRLPKAARIKGAPRTQAARPQPLCIGAFATSACRSRAQACIAGAPTASWNVISFGAGGNGWYANATKTVAARVQCLHAWR